VPLANSARTALATSTLTYGRPRRSQTMRELLAMNFTLAAMVAFTVLSPA
jgi:hypothetical protein